MSDLKESSALPLNFNRFQKAILFCACVNKDIMKDCRTAVIYYYLIGTFVIITAGAASVTGYFAATKLTDNSFPLSVLIGACWCLIIFSVDRSIILALSKKSGISFWKYAGIAVVRISIAAAASLLIGMLFEMMIFSNDISNMREHMRTRDRKNNLDSIRAATGLPALEQTYNSIKSELDSLDRIKQDDPHTDSFSTLMTNYNQANRQYRITDSINSIAIKNATNRLLDFQKALNTADSIHRKDFQRSIDLTKQSIAAYKNATEIKLGTASKLARLIKKAREDYHAEIQSRMAILRNEKDTADFRQQVATDTVNHLRGAADRASDLKDNDNLIAGVKALSELKDDPVDGPYYTKMGYLIMGIVMFVELLPLAFKLFLSQTTYEDKIETIEDDVQNEERGKREKSKGHYEKLKSELGQITEIRFNSEIDKENKLKEKRKEVVDKAIDKIASFQNSLIDAYIDAWREHELERAEENISGFKKQFKKQKKAIFIKKMWKRLNHSKEETWYFTEDILFGAHMKMLETIGNITSASAWEYNAYNEELVIRRNAVDTFYLIESLDIKNNTFILIDQSTRNRLEFLLI